MEKFFSEINKYIISILMFLAGLGFLTKYLSGDELESQPMAMLYASLALIAVGALAMPVVLEKLSQTAYRGLMAGGALAALALGYAVFYSVDEEIEFRATQERVNKTTIQRLSDIRDAQEMHLELYGNFADSFDSLTSFIQSEVVPVEFSMGSFHDTLSEGDSRDQGYVIARGEVAALAETMDLQRGAKIPRHDDHGVDWGGMDNRGVALAQSSSFSPRETNVFAKPIFAQLTSLRSITCS